MSDESKFPTARMSVTVKVNFEGLLQACRTIPELLDREPRLEIHCGDFVVNTPQELCEILRAVLKREQEKKP